MSTKLGGQANRGGRRLGPLPNAQGPTPKHKKRDRRQRERERERGAETGDATVPTPLRELSTFHFLLPVSVKFVARVSDHRPPLLLSSSSSSSALRSWCFPAMVGDGRAGSLVRLAVPILIVPWLYAMHGCRDVSARGWWSNDDDDDDDVPCWFNGSVVGDDYV